jgi:uncharacterized membrane protein
VDLVYVGASWLHSISIVVLLGYYATMVLVVLPSLADRGTAAGTLLGKLEGRALPWILGSIVALIGTGAYLMFVDPSYAGLGAIVGSTWGTLILVKHVVVIALVILGVVINRVLVPDLGVDTDAAWLANRLRLLRLACWAMVALGALVLLLTSAAQAA